MTARSIQDKMFMTQLTVDKLRAYWLKRGRDEDSWERWMEEHVIVVKPMEDQDE